MLSKMMPVKNKHVVLNSADSVPVESEVPPRRINEIESLKISAKSILNHEISLNPR